MFSLQVQLKLDKSTALKGCVSHLLGLKNMPLPWGTPSLGQVFRKDKISLFVSWLQL